MRLSQRIADAGKPREVEAGTLLGQPAVWRVRRVLPSMLRSYAAVAMLCRVPQADEDESVRVAEELLSGGADARTIAQAIRETDRRAEADAKMLETPENTAKMVGAAVELLTAGIVALRDDDDVDGSAGEWVPVVFTARGDDIILSVCGAEFPLPIATCRELQGAVLAAAMPEGVREQVATFRDGSEVGGRGDDDSAPVPPVTSDGVADAGG